MKKYLLLTSIFALAACGGGGGGHSGAVMAPTQRVAIGSSTDPAAVSNSSVTSMASEVLVDSSGNIVTPSRAGSVSYNGHTYTSYRLDDVNFKFGGEDSYINLEVDDNGQIVALSKYDRSDDFTSAPTYALSEEGRFVRMASDGNQFSKSLFIYVVDLDSTGIANVAAEHFGDGLEFMADTGDLGNADIKTKLKAKLRKDIDKIKASQPDHSNDTALENAYTAYANQIDAATSFGTPEEVHATVTVAGVGASNDLKYADLGFAELRVMDSTDTDEYEHTFSPYVGGYSVDGVKINPNTWNSAKTFTGVAIAGLDHKRSGFGDGNDVKEGVLVRQNNAQLTVNPDGTSSLVMNNLRTSENEHWYVVTVNKSAAGVPQVIISGTSDIAGSKQANAYELPGGVGTFGFVADDWKAYEQQYVKNTGTEGAGTRYSASVETDVYGTGGTDIEATSRFGFGNEVYSDGNTKHNEVAIYGAFGGKVDE